MMRRFSRRASAVSQSITKGARFWYACTARPKPSQPASAGDSSASVERKIVEWLEANADRPAQDVGRQ